ncbi:MAG TPA: melibiase, partial [Candidatus Angelobacter sp.]|nr:melibiase [Candidatus Angelobacter sp.]
MRKTYYGIVNCGLGILLLACWPSLSLAQGRNSHLNITINQSDGSYALGAPGFSGNALQAGVAAKIDGRWVQSKDYPHHSVKQSSVADDLGTAEEWAVTFSGLSDEPDLRYRLRRYADKPFADIEASVVNTTTKSINIEAIRPVAAEGPSFINLGGPVTADRILSDSFSEDRPGMIIHDFGTFYDETPNLYRAVGSQLIYNRKSRESLFAGALTSERFLSIFRIHVAGSGEKSITAFEVDATGTTELEEENSLRDSPQEDRVMLQLPLAPGAQMNSERLLLSLGTDYHRQLETYAHIIRQMHHPRISAPSPMGWWSWTAYYFGLSSGTALTNAAWEAQHLKQLGYDFFHIDEGYQ